ncbi:MAG: tyrosine-type recombinase/integrase, partial [Eubacteriales bacterium]
MAKRSTGEGTIFKRKDGRWCASTYITVDGIPKRKYIYGETQKVVKDKLKVLETQKEIITDSSMQFQEWMIQWMEQYKKATLKCTTYENYFMNINKHIVGSMLGELPLSKVSTDTLQRYYNGKLKGDEKNKGLSPRTVEYLSTLIGSALQQAYKNRLVDSNVNEFVVLAKKEEVEIVPLTIEEVKKLLVEARTSQLYSFIVLAIYTGMRKGELLGLRWEDIDMDNKVLHVHHNLCRVKNDDGITKTKLVLLKPKTKKSIRTIPLSDDALAVLKSHKVKQMETKMLYGDIYVDNHAVFAREDGSFRCPRETVREFHRVLEDAGVRKCRVHDLRHTFASILINEGESMKVIQELLGHSTITTTMDIYSHISDDK